MIFGGLLRLASRTVRALAWIPAGGRRMLLSISRRHSWRLRCPLPRTARRDKFWSMTTLSYQAISCLSSVKLGGLPPSGGCSRGGRRALDGTDPVLLCRGVTGWLGAGSPTKLGPIEGPIAKLTIGFLRQPPAGAGQGNSRPAGSAARRLRASVQMTWPLLSRRTRAGMVVTPNLAPKALPRVPAAVACGIAVHLGIV
jgi:hypothetical protein